MADLRQPPTVQKGNETLIQYAERRRAAMIEERVTFLPHYRFLAEFVKPRRGRFYREDRNKGGDRYNHIINSKATRAHRIAVAGLLSGTMSPARPWFVWEPFDPDIAQYYPVKMYFEKVRKVLLLILQESNFYEMAPTMLGELLLFATGAMSHVDDFEDVARFYTHTVGSYMIGQDDRQQVNTFMREYDMQVGAIVKKFGLKNVSPPVKSCYDNGNYDKWFPIIHFIEPNPEANPNLPFAKYNKFRSLYYEPESRNQQEALSHSGFKRFPVYCPRWSLTDNDIYGTDCPAMTVLGDIRGLQVQEKRKAQAIDKMVSPPMKGPPSLKNQPVNSLPGGLTIYEPTPQTEGLTPLYTVSPQVGELRIDMKAVEERIDDGFFVNLFRAISNMEGIQPKNELELRQRDQERLLELGPVLERVHGEFLEGMLDRLFDQAVAAGLLPPAPPALQGQEIRPRYISPLALAQRTSNAQSIERLFTFVAGAIGGGFPAAVNKVNVNEAIDQYASVIGVDPAIVVPSDQAEATTQQQQQEAQQAAQAKSANDMAGAVQKGGAGMKSVAEAAGPGMQLQNIAQAVSQRGTPDLFGGGK